MLRMAAAQHQVVDVSAAGAAVLCVAGAVMKAAADELKAGAAGPEGAVGLNAARAVRRVADAQHQEVAEGAEGAAALHAVCPP